MQPPEPYLIFTRKLQALGLRYMVGGSVAAIYYGEPRLTNDVDIIVFAPPEYVIVRKLQFFKEGGSSKHLRDIDRMLAGLGAEWSRAELNRMIREYHLDAEWQRVEEYQS